MEEQRYSYKWLFMARIIALVAGAIVMYRFGLAARKMPDAAQELNKLINEKLAACSQRTDSARCKEAEETLKEFEKRWRGRLSPGSGFKRR